jgi:glutathione S-transferase
MPARLITIAFSHFCEKARWALDRAGVDYVEDAHLPLFSYLPLKRAGARRTAPALVTASREVISDSTEILRWCDHHGDAEPLFPEDATEVETLEDDLDRRLGPASRRLAYYYLLPDHAGTREIMGRHGPGWERRLGKLARPLAAAFLRRGLRIDDAGAARSRAVIDGTFDALDARLADGRRYLCGDRFTAADLTFASLAAPLLLPRPYAEAYLPTRIPPDVQALADVYRLRPAGRLGLRLYDERGR